MHTIDVLVAGLPALTADLVEHAIGADARTRLVGRTSLSRMPRVVQDERPHVIVVPLVGESYPPICVALLARHPQLILVGVESLRGQAVFCWLAPHRQWLRMTDPAALADRIATFATAQIELGGFGTAAR